jgi:hypothetical protein
MKKDHMMLIILLLRGPSLQENAMATDESAADHRKNHLSSDDMELLEEDRVPKVRPQRRKRRCSAAKFLCSFVCSSCFIP